MIIYDKHRRVIARLDYWGLQLGYFVIKRATNEISGIVVGWDRGIIARQKSKEQCSKCMRWVGSACEIPTDPERCMYNEGPWDSCCQEFYHPLIG